MHLTAAAAKALAGIVLTSTMGPPEYKARLPLRVASSGSNWIVRGRTSSEGVSKTFLRGFHVYIDKATAELRDLATMDGHSGIPPETMRILRKDGWRPLRRRILGLPPEPSPRGIPPDLIMYLYKGVLGTPEAAIAYARVLLRATPRLATMADGDLRAEARDDVWHVTRAVPGATS